MSVDRFYKNWRPAKAHLVRGKGGVAGEVSDLRGDIEGALEKVASEVDTTSSSSDAALSAVDDLQSDIAQVADDANTALVSEVGGLNSVIAANFNSAKEESESLVAGAVGDLLEEISDVKNSASTELSSEVSNLNDRIGKLYRVDTADNVSTLLTSITPSPFKSTRIIAKIQGQRLDRLEAAAYTIEAFARALPSFGTLTVLGTPVDGDLVTIDGQAYTWFAAITPGTPFEVASGGSAAQAIINLVKAINLTGVDDTDYGAGTTKHPTVSGAVASAIAMEAVALIPGVAGNTITTTDTEVGVLLAWGGGVLASGSDMTVFPISTTSDDHEDDVLWDKAIAANGVDVEIKVTGAVDTLIKWVAEVRTIELS